MILRQKLRRAASVEPIFKDRYSMADVEALAFKLEPAMMRLIIGALKEQKASVSVDEIAEALITGDIGKVLALLNLPEALAPLAGIKAALQNAVYAGGGLAAANMLKLTGVNFQFNTLNPRLITWLQTYSLGLIKEINDKTKDGVREYLVAGMNQGRNPKSVAVEVKGIIGLTKNQSRAVKNFRTHLETFHEKRSAGAWGLGNKIDRVNGTQVFKPSEDGTPLDGIDERRLRDFRFDGQLKAAMESGKPLSQAQINKMVAAYERKYLAYRARTIARTEAIRATNVGVQDGWQQAIDAGVVAEPLVRKQWLVSRDERTCEVCGPIPSLNPKIGIPHARAFKTPDGPQMLPPMHPNCRCSVFYRVYEPSQIAAAEAKAKA